MKLAALLIASIGAMILDLVERLRAANRADDEKDEMEVEKVGR